jgi:hypothetical protein
MTDIGNPSNRVQPIIYHITLQGRLERRWTRWFGDVTITLDADGNTKLTCTVIDQAALYGLLRKIRDLGLPLISVTRVDSDGRTRQ